MDQRARGAREGRKAAALEWGRFLESGDPEPLSLAPDHTLLAAREAAHAAVPSQDPVETQAFAAGYARGLENDLSKKTRRLLPAPLRRKIHHYCFLVHWLAGENDRDSGAGEGYGIPVQEYDFRLGLAPEARKALRPGTVKAQAARAGKSAAARDWKEFLASPEPVPGRIAWTRHHRELAATEAVEKGFKLGPGLVPWDAAAMKMQQAFKTAFGASYRLEIGRRIQRLMPSGARGQTNLVCALARRLGLHFPKFGWSPGVPG